MTWTEKEQILKRAGFIDFDSEEDFEEWFEGCDYEDELKIKKAFCNAEP